MSELQVNKISPRSGAAITLGDSGDTFTIPSGATIVNSGTATGFGGGKVVQVVNVTTGALATGTTVVVNDDTIPQITEGTLFLTLPITPTSSTNKLRIDAQLVIAASSGIDMQAAIFQDSTSNSVGSVKWTSHVPNGEALVSFNAYVTAGTTSATTFTVRAGSTVAATFTLNGNGAARKLGGNLASSITITEISV